MTQPNYDPTPADTPGPGADLELVHGALAGDRVATAGLVDRLRLIPRVLHCKNNRMGRPLSKEDLEDVSQEILSTIWRRLKSYHGGSPIEAWAYRFCSLTFMNALRKRRRQPVMSEYLAEFEVADPAQDPAQEEPLQASYLLERLSSDQERPIRMRIYDGLPFQKIADLLEVPLTTAKARYYRGLEALRQMLESAAEGGIS